MQLSVRATPTAGAGDRSNGANGLLWVTYGLTIADPFVWVPNSMGVVLAATQLAVKGAFGGATA